MKYDFVKWGMIGVGDVTQKKSAPSFNKIAQSALVAVGSRTPENARRFAEENDIRKCYDDPWQVIGDPVSVTGNASNLAGIYEPLWRKMINVKGQVMLAFYDAWRLSAEYSTRSSSFLQHSAASD